MTSTDSARKIPSGTMNREFRFPVPGSPPVQDSPIKKGLERKSTTSPPPALPSQGDELERGKAVITPSNIEVPPPPPVEKEGSTSNVVDEGEDDVGDTVDIPLN